MEFLVEKIDRENKLVTISITNYEILRYTLIFSCLDRSIEMVDVKDHGKDWKYKGEVPGWIKGIGRRKAVEAMRYNPKLTFREIQNISEEEVE